VDTLFPDLPWNDARVDDLTRFAAGRLAEEETAAVKAADCDGNLTWFDSRVMASGDHTIRTQEGNRAVARIRRDDSEFEVGRTIFPDAVAAHIAGHDPARALRDVSAKRAVLAEHTPIESIYGLTCGRCVTWQDAPLAEGGETEFGIAVPDPWPCLPVRGAVASWDRHPDFKPEWAVAGT
jgi:hypothetical protein